MRVRRKLISISFLVAALAAPAAAALAAALPVVVEPPGAVEARFRAGYTPTALPARRAVPISLALAERIETGRGDHPPALRELQVDLARHLGLSVKGKPACRKPFGGRDSRTDTLVKCEDAKVGSGTLTVEVAFPEHRAVQASGRLSIYNGGVEDGRTTFWLYVLLPAPVTAVVLVPLEVRRVSHGIYGWSGTLKLPKIANGYGSVTYLGMRFRKGIFSASCPPGRSQARAVARFADGTTLQSASLHTCRTATASR